MPYPYRTAQVQLGPCTACRLAAGGSTEGQVEVLSEGWGGGLLGVLQTGQRLRGSIQGRGGLRDIWGPVGIAEGQEACGGAGQGGKGVSHGGYGGSMGFGGAVVGATMPMLLLLLLLPCVAVQDSTGSCFGDLTCTNIYLNCPRLGRGGGGQRACSEGAAEHIGGAPVARRCLHIAEAGSSCPLARRLRDRLLGRGLLGTCVAGNIRKETRSNENNVEQERG
eukprot:1160647-Pelagomonas_calceolata.AAC.3